MSQTIILPPPETIEELPQVLDWLWLALQLGATSSKDPFHTAAFGTTDDSGVHLRTVVLRHANPAARQLVCHTDQRSPKIEQIAGNDYAAWLFYDAERKVQIRAEGTVSLHHADDVADDAWEHTTLSSRRTYCITAAPGAPLDTAGSALPPELANRIPTVEESLLGLPNFSLLTTTVHHFDWLWLAATGHKRARFDFDGAKFHPTWIVP